jgi:hypothetical protein
MKIIRAFILILVLFNVILTLISYPVLGESTGNVHRVYHEPELPKAQEEVFIYLQVYDNSEIKSVDYYFCTMSPEYICYIPDPIEFLGNNTYRGMIRGFDDGYKIGYNFTINYIDNTKEYAATYSTNLQGITIEEPVPGSLYFSYQIGASNSENDNKTDDENESKDNEPKDNEPNFIPGFEAFNIIIILIAIMIYIKFGYKKHKF